MKSSPVKPPKETRIICLPFSASNYPNIIENVELSRKYIDKQIALFPELFPKEIEHGYLMKDSRMSKRLKLRTRRIKIGIVLNNI